MTSPRDVVCPVCNAQPGEPCTQPTDTGRRDVAFFHDSRMARIENDHLADDEPTNETGSRPLPGDPPEENYGLVLPPEGIPVVLDQGEDDPSDRRVVGHAKVGSDGVAEIELDDPEYEKLLGDVLAISFAEDPPVAILQPSSEPYGSIGITREQIREWSGLTDEDDITRVINAIPNSTVPEAIATIAEGLRPRVIHLFPGHVDPADGSSIIDGSITLCCSVSVLSAEIAGDRGTVIPEQATCPHLKREETAAGG